MENSLVKIENNPPVNPAFSDSQGFEHAQRVAKMLASSNLIPKEYQGNIQNTMIALEMANRIGASPLQVMQNLYIIHGKPSWSSAFIIAAINKSGKFSPLRFKVEGEGDEKTCVAFAKDRETGEVVYGTPVSIAMAKKEGWFTKSGSKWQSMPDQMLNYRAAAFFGRLYAPEILMGFQTAEEVYDVHTPAPKIDKEANRVEVMIEAAKTIEDLEDLKPFVKDHQLDLFNLKLQEVVNVQ